MGLSLSSALSRQWSGGVDEVSEALLLLTLIGPVVLKGLKVLSVVGAGDMPRSQLLLSPALPIPRAS